MAWVREDLERQRGEVRARIAANSELQVSALDFLKGSYREDYCYQWDWLGFPILQMPEDIVAYQEILYRAQPTLVVETGVAWGGSIALAASILSLLPGERRVIGIDLNLDEALEGRLRDLKLSTSIELRQGSSIDPTIVAQIADSVTPQDKVMVVLDSHHTHEHVLSELRAYASLVSPGQHLIVGDTSVRFLASDTSRVRPWTEFRNPHTAVEEFLLEDSRFVRDAGVNSKLLTTFHPGGYLVRGDA